MPADRERGINPGTPDDRDEHGLERELRDLGARLDYPPTPDLARAARRRIEEGAERAPRRGGLWASLPSLRWVGAAALVLMLAVPILSPGVRSAMSDLFSMGGMAGSASGGGGGAADEGGYEISTGSGQRAVGGMAESGSVGAAGGEETLASPGSGGQMAGATSAGASDEAMEGGDLTGSAGGGGAASVSAGDAATACATQDGCEKEPLGESLGFGEKIPLREARAGSEAPILLPRSPRLGKPDEVYDRTGAPGFVSLYRAQPRLPDLGDTRIGLILTQTPGDVGAAYLPGGTVKGVGLETVSVNGREGYWIPASGDSPEVARSAGLLAGVLLWERDGQALRLEADVSKEEAVRIAESVR